MSNIILGTGSYNNVKSGNRVSISGDGGLLVNFDGPSYKKLAPRLFTYQEYSSKLEALKILRRESLLYKEYRKLIEDKYIDSYYETRLKDLNVDELLEVLRSKYGEEIILLCYEDIDMFCHRRIIADWIELKTGIYIPEVVTEHSKVKRIEPIRYTERLKRYL
ncbi:MAG: DUF488 family protein [Bacilli bacterium]|nr:DUF488 family protein [Bacilli bacterium]